jgi:hypothetical protein
MSYIHTTLLPALLLCALLSACASDQPTSNNPHPPAIYGRVLDASGKPVANAGVSLLFGNDINEADTSIQRIAIFPNPTIDEVSIGFNVPHSGTATIRLLHANTREQVKPVYSADIDSGISFFSINVADLPNQAYILQYEIPNDSGEAVVIVGRHERSSEAPFIRPPIVRTDSDGRFTIHYSLLPLGRRLYYTFEAGQAAGWATINNSLRLVIDAPDSVHRRNWDIKVDTTAVVDSTIRLP